MRYAAAVQLLLRKYWERVRYSFWFVPILMVLGAVLAAYLLSSLDKQIADDWLIQNGWFYPGGAEGASAILAAIAGSMITIAGVVFSLTMVALAQVSSQFGPRVLRNFMRDSINQFVLGAFIATFLYCLLILRTIRRLDTATFVPHVSVTFGVLFAVLSIFVLVYFIHHVSLLIQADEMVARAGKELLNGIDELFPVQIGRGAEPLDSGEAGNNTLIDRAADAAPILSASDGYLQLIDSDAVMSLAKENDRIVWIVKRPGEYVIKGNVLASIWQRTKPSPEEQEKLCKRIRSAFALGEQRTPTQDVEYSILQLVEMAVRALSPSLNDPFTAVACVNRLASALCRLAQREMPSPYRYGDDNEIRVVAPSTSFARLLEAAFSQIRHYAKDSPTVSIQLLRSIADIAPFCARREDRVALQREAATIAGAEGEDFAKPERRALEEAYKTALRVFASPSGSLRYPSGPVLKQFSSDARLTE